MTKDEQAIGQMVTEGEWKVASRGFSKYQDFRDACHNENLESANKLRRQRQVIAGRQFGTQYL